MPNGSVSRGCRPGQAWEYVADWLDAPATWVPMPDRGHRQILGDLLQQHDVRAGLVTDAVMVAIAIEHGLTVVSADSDFARFPQVKWLNPVAPA